MPIHDWSRVSAGVAHDFHQSWSVEVRRTLDRGLLPPGYYATVERRSAQLEPEAAPAMPLGSSPETEWGLHVAETPPRMPVTARIDTDAAHYASRANRIAIQLDSGRVVAMIEIVSPGNKDRRSALAAFVGKAVEFLRNGIHLLVIDPFPPGRWDPDGVAGSIWAELADDPLPARPAGKGLTVAAFDAGEPVTAYVEPLAVGDPLPEAPLFLAPGWYVNVPLEASYRASWAETPEPIRRMVLLPGTERRSQAGE